MIPRQSSDFRVSEDPSGIQPCVEVPTIPSRYTVTLIKGNREASASAHWPVLLYCKAELLHGDADSSVPASAMITVTPYGVRH